MRGYLGRFALSPSLRRSFFTKVRTGCESPEYSGPQTQPQQLIVRQYPSSVDRKLEEQLVLSGGQPHRRTGHRHAAFRVVDRQVLQQKGVSASVRSDAACLRTAARTLATSSVGEKGVTI